MKKIMCFTLIFLIFALVGCSTEITTTESIDENNNDTYPATIRGRVLTGAGDMITAGIIITYPNGDMERVNTNILSGYELLLYEGDYSLTFTRGTEYDLVTKTISVENYKTYYMDDVRVNQLYDGASMGWYIGSLHQHTTFSDGKQGVDEVLISNISNGLYFGFLSDHNTAAGLAEWVQGNRFVANFDTLGNPINFVAMRAVEVTTDYGHFQSLGVGNVLTQADINPLKGDIPVNEILTIAEEIVRSGAIATINHPFATSVLGFTFWEITEAFDAIEIWNGLYETNRKENLSAKVKWFELLESFRMGEIKFMPATSGSDNHDIRGYYTAAYADRTTEEGIWKDNYLARGRYSAMPSTAVFVDGDLTQTAILDAIKKGHSYLTNGPRIVATIDDSIYGEFASLAGRDSIDIDIDMFSRDQVETINIYKNGQIIKTIDVTESYQQYVDVITINDVSTGDWFVFEVIGENTAYAITNPIFLAN
ncbi:CehA/McbA family metallohydrolase [Mycoplasmatota bacterium WC30]